MFDVRLILKIVQDVIQQSSVGVGIQMVTMTKHMLRCLTHLTVSTDRQAEQVGKQGLVCGWKHLRCSVDHSQLLINIVTLFKGYSKEKWGGGVKKCSSLWPPTAPLQIEIPRNSASPPHWNTLPLPPPPPNLNRLPASERPSFSSISLSLTF